MCYYLQADTPLRAMSAWPCPDCLGPGGPLLACLRTPHPHATPCSESWCGPDFKDIDCHLLNTFCYCLYLYISVLIIVTVNYRVELDWSFQRGVVHLTLLNGTISFWHQTYFTLRTIFSMLPLRRTTLFTSLLFAYLMSWPITAELWVLTPVIGFLCYLFFFCSQFLHCDQMLSQFISFMSW